MQVSGLVEERQSIYFLSPFCARHRKRLGCQRREVFSTGPNIERPQASYSRFLICQLPEGWQFVYLFTYFVA